MKEPLKGRPPSDEEIFYLQWAKESVKKNIDNANAVLAQFLTLNTALIAGGAFFGKGALSAGIQSLAPALFFIGLVLAFLGVLPHESKANTLSPSSIKHHKNCALCKKRLFMWGCAVSTGLGLLILAYSIYLPNRSLQLTARSAAALRVPSAGYACSGGN